jgi:hypothetical protein
MNSVLRGAFPETLQFSWARGRCPGRIQRAMVKWQLAMVEVAAEELTDVRNDYFGYHSG